MPIYTYTCLKELGGCGLIFEIFMSAKEYQSNSSPKCHACKNKKSVRRNFKVDISTTSSHIKTRTVGTLAEQNTSSMSEDARLAQWKKDNAYKFNDPPNEPKMKLPKGAKHIRKPDDLKPSSRQKRKLNK